VLVLPLMMKKNSNIRNLKKGHHAKSNNGYNVYGSKHVICSKCFFCSLKFYIPFFLVTTKCNIVDYWFKKPIMKHPKFIFNCKCNYQNLTQRTIMPIQYKEFTNIWLDLRLIFSHYYHMWLVILLNRFELVA